MLKKVFNISIISSLLLFLFGLVLAVNAEGFIKSITVAIGVVLLLIGVFPVIDYFRYRKEGLGASVGLISGIFSIVCGLMLLINEDLLMILIPVFIGVWMIINGINKIQVSFEIKDLGEKSWIITFIYSILIIVLGGYFIVNPISGATTVTSFIGIILCIYAVLDIIDCIIIKVKVKNLNKELDKIENNVVDEQ
jgi:putative membrane protein